MRALTNEFGVYEFAEVPDGNYGVSAERAGFVSLQFGQLDPFDATASVVLGPSGRDISANFALQPAATLVGTVKDELGEPVSNVTVKIQHYEFENGHKVLRVPEGIVLPQSDDQGHFRAYGIAPDDYVVSVSADSLPAEGRGPHSTKYAETFWPHATAPEMARVFTASSGIETNAEITLARVRVIPLSGTVLDSLGNRTKRTGILRLTKIGDLHPVAVSQFSSNGEFNFETTLAPGPYILTASTSNLEPDGAPPELGKATVSLGPEALSGLVVRMRVGATISGMVSVGEDGAPSVADAIKVFAKPVEFDGTMLGTSVSVPVKTDGTFSINNVFERSYVMLALGPSSDFRIKGVYLNGQDVSETGIPTNKSDMAGIRVVLTRERTHLTGAVLRSDMSAPTHAAVLVFSCDPAKWSDSRGRFIKAVLSDGTGRYTVTGLPDGEYCAVALGSFRSSLATDPSILNRFRPTATRVLLESGRLSSLDLRMLSRQ
jgi:hypothetical protein